MRVEPMTPEALATVREWWIARGDGEVPDSVLPPEGVVAIDGDGPAAAVWLYEPVGCRVVILDWLVTRPGLPQRVAREACRAVCRHYVHAATLAGNRHVFASVASEAMLREALNFGFSIAATGNTHLVKHLD